LEITMRRLRHVLLMVLALLLVMPATAGAEPRPGARAPLGGGSPLFTASGARCVAGFAATGGGAGHLITGAGCGRVGETVYSGANIVVGVVSAAQFPNQAVTIVRVTNTVDWELVPWVNTGSGQVTINGSAEAPVGAAVCMLGATSGWHCGTILAKNQTITFPGGTVTGLTRTSVCAEPGDSGAPFLSGDQAQGVLVGGSGNCSTGGSTFFRPVNQVLATYGLTLLTG
jgi:hypothetical protein